MRFLGNFGFLLVLGAASLGAAAVNHSGVSVSCKETTHALATAVAGNQDTVCWAAAFCNTSTTNDSLSIASAAPSGSLFTITSESITTTFTIANLAAAVPEPTELAIVGAGMVGLAVLFRKRRRASTR